MKNLLELIERLLPVLLAIESGGDVNAIGKRDDVGAYQLRPIFVEDANRIIKEKKLKIKEFTLQDRFSKPRSEQMIRVVLTHYGMKLKPSERNLKNLAMIFNMGYDNWRDTNWSYLAKVNREIAKGKS